MHNWTVRNQDSDLKVYLLKRPALLVRETDFVGFVALSPCHRAHSFRLDLQGAGPCSAY